MLAPIDRTIIDQHLRHDTFQSLQPQIVHGNRRPHTEPTPQSLRENAAEGLQRTT